MISIIDGIRKIHNIAALLYFAAGYSAVFASELAVARFTFYPEPIVSGSYSSRTAILAFIWPIFPWNVKRMDGFGFMAPHMTSTWSTRAGRRAFCGTRRSQEDHVLASRWRPAKRRGESLGTHFHFPVALNRLVLGVITFPARLPARHIPGRQSPPTYLCLHASQK